MNIGKLGNGGEGTMDTCNAVGKTQNLINDTIIMASRQLNTEDPMVLVGIWQYHMRCVVIEGSMQAVSAFLRDKLINNLEGSNSVLHVLTSLETIIQVVKKLFGLTVNYPKGLGKLFFEHMIKYQTGCVFLHVFHSNKSR